jgi:hypothetical protein
MLYFVGRVLTDIAFDVVLQNEVDKQVRVENGLAKIQKLLDKLILNLYSGV